MLFQPNSIIINNKSVLSNIQNIFDNTEYSKTPYEKNNILDKLNSLKTTLCNHKFWNLFKKLLNDYELLNFISYNKNQSIIKYRPLSRSFYKMWEFLYKYNILNNKIKKNTKINVICIAEAPGGFVDAINKYLYEKKYINYNIDTFSLIDTNNNNIPEWFNANKKFKLATNINIITDTDGNLYDINNIYYYKNKLGNKYDLITADGGFDFSSNYIKQETNFQKLFLCEIITALCLQKKGGTFICKCFDIYTLQTQQIIYILYILYNSITFVKPNISRPTNSEKYIILKNFKGIDNDMLNKLINIIDIWDDNIESNLHINLPNDYIKNIMNINNNFNNRQLKYYNYLNNTINNKITLDLFTNIIQNQIQKAINFSKLYNLKINYNSDFIKLSIEEIYKKYFYKLKLN